MTSGPAQVKQTGIGLADHGWTSSVEVLNGCCGNINPWPAFTPDFVPDHRRMGQELTRTVEAILPTLSFENPATLQATTRSLPLPIRDVTAEDHLWAEKMLQEYPQPLWQKDDPTKAEWAWMEAAMLKSLVHCKTENDAFIDRIT